MEKSYIGVRIMGWLLTLSGAYLVGQFWVITGVLFMIWGSAMMFTKPKYGPRRVVKDWLGNQTLED